MKLILLISIFLMTLLHAVVVNEVTIKKLSKEPTWLKLLHFKDGKSTIIDNNFFLDDNGNISAKKELERTIEAYSKPFTTAEKHAQCRYPARYYWLSTQIELKNYQSISSKCTKLKSWKLLDNTDSISVVFVSGYLGNPASAFGHSFIKVNESANTNDNLFDTSISYGALLPDEYTMPEYIYNGITGGYKAAYSDKYYYHQDVTYSNEEHREMWEYRLNLSREKKKLFLLHAWELMGKKFQYFFLNRNCGYKVSELLELVIDEKIIKNSSIWYAPIETFYKLKEINKKHKNIIGKIIYIPSKEQQLYAHYKGLNSNEKEISTEMIGKELTNIPTTFQNYSKEEKGNSLDFVLAYRKYNFPKESNRKLLFNRFKLPVRRKKIHLPKKKINITNYAEPSYIGVSVEKNKFLNLHLSTFSLAQNAYNGLNGDELVVFDTTLNIENKKVKLSRFDLIRILKLKTEQLPFEEKNPFSWSLHIGTENQNGRDYFGKVGGGLAWEVNSYIKFYTMLNLSVHTQRSNYRIQPKVGLFNNFNHLRISSTFGYEKDIQEGTLEKIVKINSQYQTKENIALFFEYDLNHNQKLEAGIKLFY
jgi:hypothetical protein